MDGVQYTRQTSTTDRQKRKYGLIIGGRKRINRTTEELIKAVIKANLLQGNNLARFYSLSWLKKACKFDAKPDPEFTMPQPAPPLTPTNMVAMVIRPGQKRATFVDIKNIRR